MSRFSRLVMAACALVAAACSDSTSPPTPTKIVLSSPAVTIDAIGATQTVSAVVMDQHDQPMSAATVAWTSSNSATTVAPAAGNSASAILTAKLNGESIITATSGQASATLKITVAQAPARVEVLGGNAQTGSVNAPLSQPVGARVLDRLGVPVANQVVSFSVAQGGGSLSAPTATTNGDGAAYVTWTLGKVALQPQQLTAAIGALPAATFTATAIAAAPASIRAMAGDAQSGPVGTSLPVTPSVVITDTFGNPVSEAVVTFVPNSGSVATPVARTNESGVANAGLWTLGTSPGSKTLTASIGGLSVALTATAQVGTPAIVTVAAGNNQSAAVSTRVAVAPSVRVTDAFSNVVAGTQVIFTVTAGGGSITGGTMNTDANGIATVGSWTLGAVAGTNTLAASVGTNAGAAFIATATGGSSGTPTTPATMTASTNSGTLLSGIAGAAVIALPSIVVRDASGSPVSGVNVSFSVTAGGGVITGATATTSATGVATLGGWTLGTPANVNTVTATITSAGVAGGPFVFTVAGCEGGGGAGYAITVCYTTPMTATQKQAFVAAAAKWSSVITSDLPDAALSIGASQCDVKSPSISMNVDDLAIFAAIEPIDGVNGILGSAGWCFRRSGGLPVLGSMRFDIADVAALETSGRLNEVILHEMGHVIGIGTMWSAKGLLQSPSTSASSIDTYFSGASGIAGFDAIGGLSYTGGQKVPVENTGGSGTINAHWRESVLRNELMTGFLNTGVNPMSALTVRSLEDIGYTVNAAAADPFALALSLRSSLGGDPGAIDLGNDVYQGPQSTIDTRGRITRIR